MTVILHIAYFKLRSLLKSSSDWKPSNSFKLAASLLVFGGFAVGAFFAARFTTDYLLDSARLGSFLLHRFIEMMLFVFFLSINVGNVIVSYATFYRSQEVSYYLTKPISHTSLFLVKFFDSFFYSSAVFFLIAFAVLLGYGTHFHLPWAFYVETLLFMLLPFMLLSGCIAVVLLLVFMNFADTIGVRKLIASLVILYLAALYGYFALENPVGLVREVLKYYPHTDQYFAYLIPSVSKFLPNHWIAESLYWTVKGDANVALSYTIMLDVVTIVMFIVMVLAGRKLFYRSWIVSMGLQSSGKSYVSSVKMLSLTNPSKIDPQMSVLLKKEFWQFVREPSQWIHLGIISVLLLAFVTSIGGINLHQPLPLYQTISYLVLFLFNAFLIASIALRFVYPSIGIEGRDFWSVLSAPVNRRKVYWVKFLFAFIPVLVLSEALVLVSHHSLMTMPGLYRTAALIMVAVAFAMVGLNFGVGSFFTDFKERNPIRIASSQSATLTFLICIFYLTVLVALLFLPLNQYFTGVLRGGPTSSADLYNAGLAILVLSFVVGFASLFLGKRALRRDF